MGLDGADAAAMTLVDRIRGRARNCTSGLVAGALAVLLALPLIVVVTSPLHAPTKDWDHVVRSILPSHSWETLLLLAMVLVMGWIIAVPSAWFISSFTFPGRSLFRWLLVMPLALPTYISAYAYAGLLGPTGSITSLLDNYLGIRPDILGLPGLAFVLALVLSPYIHLPARAAFAQGMRQPLDAARVLGAGPWRRFSRIALPLARPAIAGGALLMAMETLNDYGAVKYYGVRTLTTGIFRSWGGLYDLGSALRLCMILLGLIGLLMWLERRARRKIPRNTDQAPRPLTTLNGVASGAVTLWCALIAVLAFALPLYRIITDVLQGPAPDTWYTTLPAFGNTMMVSVLAAGLTLGIGILFTYRERYFERSRILAWVAGAGYAIPGAVIAISVMALAGAMDRSDLVSAALIGSIALLVYAFVVRFLAVALQPMTGNIAQQAKRFDEAARTLGATPWQAFKRVNLPLLRPAVLAAALLVSIDVIKELPLTLILRPFNFETLSTLTYGLASIEELQQASWPSLFIVIGGLVPVLFLERLLAQRS